MRPLPTTTGRDVRLGAFLQSHQHSFARAELLARWPRSALDRSLHEGDIVRLLPGVYCGHDHIHDPVVMGDALNLWVPSGLVTGALALHLYSPSLPVPGIVDVVVPHGRHVRAPEWARVHQTELPRASGSAKGVRCVVPERALIDTWRFAAPAARRPLLYEALWARTCSWRQLARELQRTPRLPTRRELERLLAWFAKGTTSPLEVRARRDVFTGRCFREFEWQAHVTVGPRKIVADMLHRAAKVMVELDGAQYHHVPDTWRADRARDVELAAAGYVTVRFGWDDIVRRPEWCRTRLSEVLASRIVRPVST